MSMCQMAQIANTCSIVPNVVSNLQSKARTIIPNKRQRRKTDTRFMHVAFAEKLKLLTRTAYLSCLWSEVSMRMKKAMFVLIMLCCCAVVLSVNVFADNYGGEDDFGSLGGSSEATTESSEPSTTGPVQTETTVEPGATEPSDTETTIAPETTEPEVSESEGDTTEPEVSDSETTEPEESATEDETTVPVEQTTEQIGETTTASVNQPSETETQSSDNAGGLSIPLIIAGLAVLSVTFISLALVLLIKYFRAQNA